ncbi:hypothetical protein ES707_18438 [subsurface metagenome]
MALIKFGGGVVQASGSIAGTTHARNRFGNYIRPRTKPVNPKSDRQGNIRAIMQLLVAYWSSPEMSDLERRAWNTYAASIAMKNRLGESIYLTGFNHFVRSNAAILTVLGTIIEPGPVTLSLPGADETLAIAGDNGTQLLTVAFDDTQDWCKEDDGFLSIEMGRPKLHTRNFFGGPFRNAGAIAGNTAVPIESPQTLVAPFTLTDAQKVWTRGSIIRADGRLSNKFTAPAFIVGGLLPLYNVTGTLTPDMVCNYAINGAFNGKAYFRRTDGGFFIWWDGNTKWTISILLGIQGEAWQELEAADPAGVYTIGGTATGECTVAAGEHP